MSEIHDFYERYIEAFNTGDRDAFAACFHRPVTVVPATRYDDRRAGRDLPIVTDPAALWAPLPDHWARSSIDSITTLTDVGAFAPRAGLTETQERRDGIVATVTRWDTDGEPYEHIQALYILTREGGVLGIKVLVELAVATTDS